MFNKNRSRFAFGVLSVIHVTLLIMTLMRGKDRKVQFISLMSNIAFAYYFEYFVLNLFQAYSYSPKILKIDKLDNILGAVLSQAVYVPFTSLFLTVFKVQWWGRALVIFYFYCVEKLFIFLNIYRVNWWKPIYTSFTMPIHFILSDFWYKHIQKGTPWVLTVSLFNMIVVLSVNVLFLLAVLRKVKFGLGKVHSWYEHFSIGPLYSIVLSVYATKTIKLRDWTSKMKIISFGVIVDFLLERLNLLHIGSKKRRVASLLFQFILMFIALFSKQVIEDVNPSSVNK
ncbi:hypothetical protein JCM9140_4703 [Halalkalibacter wakoensis JCM 9140]|uniref:Uncharacterized protein n=1 Tax=Halalkalibacter wakoensis JCM 9140 TaxID=1236970 RepID=W4Q902_9BACI|nr:hypothetical protein [Halalkalibacter wakoensis]GAE28465.1 hypothetical protein JCM9140_4703 [Halalkalibacter wakoensis JCM 9140]